LVPTVLLQGETGTGKGLVARVLHESGPRVEGPFLEVNCAAIPETLLEAELFGFEAGAFTDAKRPKPGLFEAASGGTLFLDEVDALPLALQGKLLKAIEEKRVRRVGALADKPVDIKLTVSSPWPRTPISTPASRMGGFVLISTTAWRWFSWKSPRCGSGEMMCSSSHASFCATMPRAIGSPPSA
jgi:Sigma-54 interaction domain